MGGRAEDHRFYDDEGRVLYGQMAQSPDFRQGIQRLLDGASRFCLAILCGEEDPIDCHRRLLVGRVLRERDVQVMHIRGDGRVQSEDQVAAEAAVPQDQGPLDATRIRAAAQWIADSRDVVLGVGLTRKFRSSNDAAYRHWLQVNNIHLKETPTWPLG